MLDPRIYRTALIPVALAIVVLAFSLSNQPGALGTTLVPDAFNAQNAAATLARLTARYPDRRPGSPGDQKLGRYVASDLAHHGFSVSTDEYRARTVDGERTLENVTGTLTGSGTGSPIVIVAHRDATTRPGRADLTATATMLELARVLSERTNTRSLVIASISGSAGASGAARLASQLARPIDAVIVLGDLGGPRGVGPAVVPWSGAAGGSLAPPALRGTLATALQQDAGVRAGAPGVLGQLARLAFPLTLSEQGPFVAAGDPAVLISSAGERGPAAGAPVSQDRLAAGGRAVLRAVTALQQSSDLPSPSPYLVYDRKLVPLWAVRLLVLALLLAPVATSLDGFARARRRGHHVAGWIAWVLAGAVPFALLAAVAAALGLAGVMPAAPPLPVRAGAVPLRTGGIATMAALALLLAGSLCWLRPRLTRLAGTADGDLAEGGAAIALLLVLCACTLAIWAVNPLAAALAVPALHLWMWAVAPGLRLRLPVAAALVALGAAPAVLEAVYYARAFGLGPGGLAWTATMLLGGGSLGIAWTLAWCVLAGCLVSAAVIAVRSSLAARAVEHLPVTVRGPVTYAGPGSLGGTESALRARR
jgi:hypothetical protein